jgi:hypothetical protein
MFCFGGWTIQQRFQKALVAQAKVGGLTIVSRDANVLQYPVPSLLA